MNEGAGRWGRGIAARGVAAVVVAIAVACSGESSVARCVDDGVTRSSGCYSVSYCDWDKSPTCEGTKPPVCELPMPCPVVVREYVYDYDVGEPVELRFDAVAADCVIGALRSGERAFHWYINTNGIEGNAYTVQVLGDGTALVSSYEGGDLGGSGELVWIELPGPECFAGCGASGEAFERCLADLMTHPCPPGEPVCP